MSLSTLDQIYRCPLGLLTDLYQITMAFGYWKSGRHEEEAVFCQHLRKMPFGGGYAICCGLEAAVDFLRDFRLTETELEYLESITDSQGRRLFEREFLDYLRALRFSGDLDAVYEGDLVFCMEPMLRFRGPLLLGQLLETPMLNLINFSTLVATKASRIYQAAGGAPVLEFGLRRAQGVDGALTATRAAYVGGCSATSNVLGGKLFGIPVRGTHAHSWVMSFGDEREAFRQYAAAMPDNVILLVDTYDTVTGVRRAIEVGHRLQREGRRLLGIRLDSGDLVALSRSARQMLDEAGLNETKIVASGDLDENVIAEVRSRGACIDLWGVGTRLVTAHEDPALSGVYKLAAYRRSGKPWTACMKRSDEVGKQTLPGLQRLRRYYHAEEPCLDLIYDEEMGVNANAEHSWLSKSSQTVRLRPEWRSDEILKPVFRAGKCVYELPPLQRIRERSLAAVARLPESIRRRKNPDPFPVALEVQLEEQRRNLLAAAEPGKD